MKRATLMLMFVLSIVVLLSSCVGSTPGAIGTSQAVRLVPQVSGSDGVYVYKRPFGRTLIIAVKDNSLQVYDASTGGMVYSEEYDSETGKWTSRGSSSGYGYVGAHGGSNGGGYQGYLGNPMNIYNNNFERTYYPNGSVVVRRK